jgi:hypothetical protein
MGSPKGSMRHLDLFPTLHDEAAFLAPTPQQVQAPLTTTTRLCLTCTL